jgi:Peptidase family C54
MYDPIINFKMIVAREGNIFLDKIVAKSENWKNSVFVAVPVRLGLNHIEPEYLQAVRDIYRKLNHHNVGIAGGRDFSALYFVGLTDNDNLLYLDPHIVHDAMPSKHFYSDKILGQASDSEYRTSKIKAMKLTKMCTSVAIGFYIRDEESFIDF